MENTYPAYRRELLKAYNAVTDEQLEKLAKAITSRINNGTIFVCGNGGSAATAEHMSCDIGKTVYKFAEKSPKNLIRIVSLNSNVSYMTAVANDISYDKIFSEQFTSLAKKGDLLIVITGSGNSPNIIEVVRAARSMGVSTFGLIGFGGGKVMPLLDDYICVDSNDYGVVEDCHLIINHMITDYLKLYMKSIPGN